MTPRPDIVEPFPDHPGMDVRTMKGSDVAADRFTDLWRRRVASPPSPDGATVYAELCRLYTAPYRRYHNLGHIEDCLRLADEVAPLLVDRDAVDFGLWFHDAVYDTGVTTNEWRSAELFLNVSAGAPFVFGIVSAVTSWRRGIGERRAATTGASWSTSTFPASARPGTSSCATARCCARNRPTSPTPRTMRARSSS
jgi:hypothetical protein